MAIGVAMQGRRRLAIAHWIQYLGPILFVVTTSIVTRYPKATWPSDRYRDLALKIVLEWQLVLIVVLALVMILARVMQDILEHADTTKLKQMVDSVHATYFVGVPANDCFRDRVTLFKANRSQTKLEAVCRSGTQ
jgi:hypothetical protein